MSMHETFSTGLYGNDAVIGQVIDNHSLSKVEQASIDVGDGLQFLNIDWFAAWG